MRKALLFFSAFVVVILLAWTNEDEANRIVGQWYTEDSTSIIRIFKATNGKYYGKIQWIDDPFEDDGVTPKIDDENPDPAHQNDPIIGLMIMKGFNYEGDGEWWDGTIYDPDNGKTYNCVIRLESDEHIFVRGYIGKAWMGLGRTTDWWRVNDR